MDFLKYITENAIILVPVLYIVGAILKSTELIKDKYIPILLMPIGIAFSIAIIGVNVEAIIQGILVTGATVYSNQLIKQLNKNE